MQLGGPHLSAVDVPVLIVNGANDHPYIDTVHNLVDAIPNSRLAVIADCDHLATVTDPRFKPKNGPTALYVVDIGPIHYVRGPKGPEPQAFPGTGVVWRIGRKGT